MTPKEPTEEDMGNLRPPEWISDAIFYQIFPDRFYNGDPGNDPEPTEEWGNEPKRNNHFGGDLEGIIEKLDYVDRLGVTALYLNPIFRSPSNHKYDTTDYYRIDPHFGDRSLLKELVENAHDRGIKVVLDGVFNHCGEGLSQFKDVKEKGRDSDYWDWYTINDFPIETEPEPNYRCWAGVPQMPEFNRNHPEVREFILDVVRYWIEEADVDGWRLDTVNYLEQDFVKEVRIAAREVKDDAYVMGEVVGPAASWFKSGALDGVMNYELRRYVVDWLARGKFGAREFSERIYFLRRSYPAWANFASYDLVGSHDRARFMTLCGSNEDRFKLGYFFLFTFLGAPAIYYGDEIGMEGGDDPDCRRTFPWDEGRYEKELFGFFQDLTKLRSEVRPLRRGSFLEIASNDHVFAYVRRTEREAVLAAINSRSEKEGIGIPVEEISRSGKPEFLYGKGSFSVKNEQLQLELPAFGYLLLKLSP